MVRFCIEVALYQISRGRKFIIENPETSHIWKTKEFLMLATKNGVTWDVMDMRRHGMKDPSSITFQKDLSILYFYGVVLRQDTHMTDMKMYKDTAVDMEEDQRFPKCIHSNSAYSWSSVSSIISVLDNIPRKIINRHFW